jgi:hypothetical protein
VLLFHHPVVWWLSRRIRTVREHLCDDLAAQAIGEPRRLAEALAALDDFRVVPPQHSQLALAADGGILFNRIQRLVAPVARTAFPLWVPAALLALALPCAAAVLRAVSPDSAPIPVEPALVRQLDALAAQEGLDPNLLRAMAWAESGFNRNARSPRGALGVLQVMPATAGKFGATDLHDPIQVMAAGAKYLRFLLDRYQGDVAKAVAAYNGGEKAIDAGALSQETTSYRALVLDLFNTRSVQPAPPLGEAEVDGVLRRQPDGTWLLTMRASTRTGLRFEILSDRPGDPAGKTFVTVISGSNPPKDAGTWQESRPKATFPAPPDAPVIIRCADPGMDFMGETRLVLGGSWKTFAFKMEPKKP